jgi:hypothetical protein
MNYGHEQNVDAGQLIKKRRERTEHGADNARKERAPRGAKSTRS